MEETMAVENRDDQLMPAVADDCQPAPPSAASDGDLEETETTLTDSGSSNGALVQVACVNGVEEDASATEGGSEAPHADTPLSNAEISELESQQQTALQRLAAIRGHKKRVIDILHQMKGKGESEMDKEAMGKLIAAYDGFKAQEDEYMALLRRILEYRRNRLATDEQPAAAEAASEGEGDGSRRAASLRQLGALREQLAAAKGMVAQLAGGVDETVSRFSGRAKHVAPDEPSGDDDDDDDEEKARLLFNQKVQQLADNRRRMAEISGELTRLRDRSAAVLDERRCPPSPPPPPPPPPPVAVDAVNQLHTQLAELSAVKERLVSLQNLAQQAEGADAEEGPSRRQAVETHLAAEHDRLQRISDQLRNMQCDVEQSSSPENDFEMVAVGEPLNNVGSPGPQRETLAGAEFASNPQLASFRRNNLLTTEASRSQRHRCNSDAASSTSVQLKQYLDGIQRLFRNERRAATPVPDALPSNWQQQQALLTSSLMACQQQLQTQQLEIVNLQNVVLQMRMQSSQSQSVETAAAQRQPTSTSVLQPPTQLDGRPLSQTSLNQLFAPVPGVVAAVDYAQLSRRDGSQPAKQTNVAQSRESAERAAPAPYRLSCETQTSDHSFDQLRENIYAEVATLISQNEQRPQFLVELFRELQLLTTRDLRERALDAVQQVVRRYLSEPPLSDTDSADDAADAVMEAIVASRAPPLKIAPRAPMAESKSDRKSSNKSNRSDVYITCEEVLPDDILSSRSMRSAVDSIIRHIQPVISDFASEDCGQEFLVAIRNAIMTESMSRVGADAASSPFFQRQLGSILADTLAKFQGLPLTHCKDELLADVSDALLNELSFFRLMRGADRADDGGDGRKARRESLMSEAERELRAIANRSPQRTPSECANGNRLLVGGARATSAARSEVSDDAQSARSAVSESRQALHETREPDAVPLAPAVLQAVILEDAVSVNSEGEATATFNLSLRPTPTDQEEAAYTLTVQK